MGRRECLVQAVSVHSCVLEAWLWEGMGFSFRLNAFKILLAPRWFLRCNSRFIYLFRTRRIKHSTMSTHLLDSRFISGGHCINLHQLLSQKQASKKKKNELRPVQQQKSMELHRCSALWWGFCVTLLSEWCIFLRPLHHTCYFTWGPCAAFNL